MGRGKKKQKGQRKRTSPEKKLFGYLRNSPGKSFTRKALFKKFIREFSKEAINDAIDKLAAKDKVLVSKNRVTFQPKRKAKKKGVYEGTVDMTQYGYAFIICKYLDKDVFVSAKHLHRALDGDKVNVAVIRTKRNGKMDGEIVEILERAHRQFLGTVHVHENFAFVIPDRRNMLHDIYIPNEELSDAKTGDKVVAEITHWPAASKSPVGRIVQNIGKSGSNDVEMKSILLENNFPLTFPDEVLKEAEAVSEQIAPEEIKNRNDLRDITTFTIDPDDAKDFDDALSFRELENGNIEIGVHIADVTHYVRPESALDEEALNRGTSVYLVDRVLPMLPEKLSNKVCSLRPDEEKLTFSVLFEMNEKAEVKSVWYGKTIIKSDKRFTYGEAQKGIDTGKGIYGKELQILNDIAKKLRQERMKAGSIPFETVEVKIKLDKDAKPIDIVPRKMVDANWLIEDFMLLANRYVAKYVSKLRQGKGPVPFVYRVHDKPDMLKLEMFAEFAKNFGYQIKFTEPEEVADQLNRLFNYIRGKKEQNVLEQLAIRSMAKANYTTKNIGHFGLAFEYYTHFTSPIRRYPDILAHRILHQCLENDPVLYQKETLQEMCNRSSEKERDALEAERESVKYKMVEFMQDKIGQVFDGIISGVIYKGLFVELENYCEGFVLARDLGYHDMVFDDTNYSLVDYFDGTTYRLGDPIRVKLISTNLENRTIDFELA